jgi:hypothetical protein
MQRLVGHERLRGCVGHPRYALARLRVTEEGACAACWSADKGYAHAHCFDHPGDPSLDEERIDRTVQVLEERGPRSPATAPSSMSPSGRASARATRLSPASVTSCERWRESCAQRRSLAEPTTTLLPGGVEPLRPSPQGDPSPGQVEGHPEGATGAASRCLSGGLAEDLVVRRSCGRGGGRQTWGPVSPSLDV